MTVLEFESEVIVAASDSQTFLSLPYTTPAARISRGLCSSSRIDMGLSSPHRNLHERIEPSSFASFRTMLLCSSSSTYSSPSLATVAIPRLAATRDGNPKPDPSSTTREPGCTNRFALFSPKKASNALEIPLRFVRASQSASNALSCQSAPPVAPVVPVASREVCRFRPPPGMCSTSSVGHPLKSKGTNATLVVASSKAVHFTFALLKANRSLLHSCALNISIFEDDISPILYIRS
mmetsp:Transcript_17127/g.31479  ORF Transcript_17127/g.31479 Transcript_17127/m.31479 type:complete len:236 (+) Transcript_17127:480-1187(+)